MELSELKKIIGRKCMVIDPRSKKKQFEPATVLEVKFNVWLCGEEIRETFSFNVKLDRWSKCKGWDGTYQDVQRSFEVSGNRIQISMEV